MPTAVAARSVQGQAVADLVAEPLLEDEGGEDWFPREMPTREEMRLYKEPVQYWEPEFPGMAMMPYPRLGHLSSQEEGRWVCHAKWEEDAVRKRLTKLVGDPDELKVTPDELAIVRGKKPGESQYCHTPLCKFVSCSPLAARLHAQRRGHSIQPLPRKAK